jgi:uncharacterized protein (TIGR00730 family)
MKKFNLFQIDDTFLNSRDGRIIRTMSDFLYAKSKLEAEKIDHTVVIFGSARIQDNENLQAFANEPNFEQIKKASVFYQKARELAFKLASYSKTLPENEKFYLCSGGGGGIMEACNRGAFDAGEKNLGFNIELPFEQHANPYITPSLSFNFHYFFMRKFWFSYLAKAFIVFPGGFGTMDELFENLTLMQTNKMGKKLPVVLFGKEFFEKTLNFELMHEYGLISPNDEQLFYITDSVDDAFAYTIEHLGNYTNLHS